MIDLYEAEVPLKYRREIIEEPMRRAQVEVRIKIVVVDSSANSNSQKEGRFRTIWAWVESPQGRDVIR